MTFRPTPLYAAVLATFAALAAAPAVASPSGVVISQVYGGGGNTGATWKSDFVELFNAGATPVSLAGWSVQNTFSTGTTWTVTKLTNVVLQPRQYYLVKQADGAGGTQDLPTPDAVGTYTMGATSGKAALVSSETALTGANPVSADLQDLVGYGTTANGYEGSGPAPAPSNTTADLRAAAGCTDTNQNAADFATGTPTPRNTASPLGSCGDTGPVSRTIMEIQGSGATSPHVGTAVRTSGIVTRVNNNGFFLQDATGDGNPATSDGLFVFTGTAPTVTVNQHVELTGTVAEFNTGAGSNTDTAAHPVTELTGISNIVASSGQAIAPVVIDFPEVTNDDLERYEGMLVTINGPLTASQNYFQGRYGQVTLSAGGRMETPTNRHRPGTPEALALADANARSRIILDDGTTQQNPNPTPYFGEDDTLRAGDTVASVTGVVDYGLATSSNTGFGDYKLHPTAPVAFSRDNARTAAPAPVPGNLKLASFNVLNYFTTFTDGTDAFGGSGKGCQLGDTNSPANCRGASNMAEFTRQRTKIIEAIAAIDADALGLIEMQNNGAVAVQNLVDGLNAKLGTGTYTVVTDPANGTGTDAIKVAMIYKPARLAVVGAAQSDTDAVHNRPPLAHTFAAANGERFTLVVNHMKSKGSCPEAGDPDYAGNFDAGDGQGCWNARRVAQAQRTAAWVSGLATGAGTDRALLLGDMNAYAQEDPVVTYAGAGYADQIARFNGFGYSYVFDGAAGRLDHALATASLAPKVTDATEWHVNADEPVVIDYNTEFKQPLCGTCGPDYYTPTAYRSSDHDPVVLGLYLVRQINGTGGKDKLVGTPGDDQFVGGAGADKLTGGAGDDVFTYTAMADARDTLVDFTPGEDRIDLRALLASIGYAGSDPIADGVVRVADRTGGKPGSRLQIDVDGSGGGAKWKDLLVMPSVAAAAIVPARDLVFFDATSAARR